MLYCPRLPRARTVSATSRSHVQGTRCRPSILRRDSREANIRSEVEIEGGASAILRRSLGLRTVVQGVPGTQGIRNVRIAYFNRQSH
jgi:hypothetical protein